MFIIGFDQRHPRWRDLVAQAAVTNFFYAIHHGNLTVRIDDRSINRETLEIELDRCGSRQPAYQYYQAIRDTEPELTRPSGGPEPMGQLSVYVSTAEKAPRRVAHVNRRGMLITDDRRFENNPFYPRGGAGWTPWCAVTIAATEDTDRYIRRLEPPAHDAIHHRLPGNPDEAKAAERELRHQRQQINDIVRQHIDAAHAGAGDNLTELAELFPDLPEFAKGDRELSWRQQALRETDNAEDEDEDSADQVTPRNRNESVLEENSGAKDSEDDDRHRQNTNKRAQTAEGQPRAGTLQQHSNRVLRTGPKELAVSFTMPDTMPESDDAREIGFTLRATGEQYLADEHDLALASVQGEHATLQDDNTVRLSAAPGQVVNARITLLDALDEYCAYKIQQHSIADMP